MQSYLPANTGEHAVPLPSWTVLFDLPTPMGWKAEVDGRFDLGVGYVLRWLTCAQVVIHPSGNQLIVNRPRVKCMTP